MKRFFYLMLLLSFMSACTPEDLDITIPQAETKMVVYSQTLPDQAMIVSLSKSFSALQFPPDNGDDFDNDSTQTDTIANDFFTQFLIDSAIVTVVGPDYNDTLVGVSGGIYIAPFFPFSPGNNYCLEAFDPVSRLSITATTQTLPVANFESFTAKKGQGEDSTEITLNYKVADLSGENYYLVNIYTDSIPNQDFFGLNSSDEGRSFVFTDREYPPNEIVREDKFYDDRASDTIVATLTNISRAYYDFLVARNRAGNSFLSEPVSFPSNVEGGYGYFNLHFPSATTVLVD